MTYNTLNYSGSNTDKDAAFRIVIENAEPDMIIAEEIGDQSGYTNFLSHVLNYTTNNLYAGAPFTEQSETNVDIALYYKPTIFSFVSTSRINTTDIWGRRDVIEFVMRHDASGVEFRIYGCHLKAGTNSDDENERTAEATQLRNYLNSLDGETPFIVAGDLNLYDNGEGAFQVLIESQSDNDGRCFDPVDRIGNWHNNASYADVHTQSPRGGNYGGMDDRFDWLLVSDAILNGTDIQYLENSYTPFGNDGNHFNLAINEGTNTAVSAAVADALVGASDHLPVFLELEFDDLTPSEAKLVITEIMPNPSMVSDTYGEWFEVYNQDSISHNLFHWTLKDADTDSHRIEDNLIIEPGNYIVLGRNADSTQNGGLQVDYVIHNFILSNTVDEIIFWDSLGYLVDEVVYDNTFPFGNGASMYVADMELDNNNPDNWYVSSTPYGVGDFGTPGKAWDDTLGIVTGSIPVYFHLSSAYPNPFNNGVRWEIELPVSAEMTIKIHNLLGEEVTTIWSGYLPRGKQKFSWNPVNQASGIYFITLQSVTNVQNLKLIYLK